VDALRKTLLNARSIAHPDPAGGGFTGAQIARMFAQLGIAEAVKPKVVLMYAFTGGVENIAKGDAEIGLFNISEILPVKGVTLVGPLPPEVQNYITFAGALHAGSGSTDAPAAYLRSLSDPGARDTWKTSGFEMLGSAD
jgi:molybdate transport system substrate-binding protein